MSGIVPEPVDRAGGLQVRPEKTAPVVHMREPAGREPLFGRQNHLPQILPDALLDARVSPGCNPVDNAFSVGCRSIGLFRLIHDPYDLGRRRDVFRKPPDKHALALHTLFDTLIDVVVGRMEERDDDCLSRRCPIRVGHRDGQDDRAGA